MNELSLITWVRDKPGVTGVLLGAGPAQQLEAQLDAVVLSLDSETAAQLDRIWWDIPRSFVW